MYQQKEVRCDGPENDAIRSFISFAALLVKVSATIDDAGTFLLKIKLVMRAVITRVFPEPAPATTRTGPASWCTAFCCDGLRLFAKKSLKESRIIFPYAFLLRSSAITHFQFLSMGTRLD